MYRCEVFIKKKITIFQSNLIITQKVGRLLLIGLNRPDKSNMFNNLMAKELHDSICNELEPNPDLIGGVIYGKGKDFCLGVDLEEFDASKMGQLSPMVILLFKLMLFQNNNSK